MKAEAELSLFPKLPKIAKTLKTIYYCVVLEGDKNFGEESTSAIKINRPGRVLQIW